jgi:uncharacterized membrane protein YbhN (UPF0104 family)
MSNSAAADLRTDGEMPEELRSRHLLVRVAQLAAVVAVVAVAISALPGLGQVRDRFEHADAAWLVLLGLAELGSCAGYLLVFRETFCAAMPWGLSYDIAMSELAANSLLPAGGAGGLALGVWALRQSGMPTGHIARRSVAFFVVTSAANFFGVILAGVGVFAGVIAGSGSWLLTLLPAIITAAGVVLVVLSPQLLRGIGGRGAEPARGRVRAALRGGLATVADGVEQAIGLLRSRSLGVTAGSFGYMAFDIAALACGFAAVGHVPPFGTLVLGYLIGQLGNLIPLPGGVGGTEGGLVGMFALYHVNVAEATAAVFAYRLFQLVLPALLGAPAFVALRRRLARSDRPAAICSPLGLDVVKLPARG